MACLYTPILRTYTVQSCTNPLTSYAVHTCSSYRRPTLPRSAHSPPNEHLGPWELARSSMKYSYNRPSAVATSNDTWDQGGQGGWRRVSQPLASGWDAAVVSVCEGMRACVSARVHVSMCV